MNWRNGFILGIIFSKWIVYCIGHQEGNVRLMNGGGELSGFVEIYHNRQWGRVCDQAWDLDNAIVTCVQLGHNGAVESPTIPAGVVRPSSGLVWLVTIMCDGYNTMVSDEEARLMDCGGGQTWLGTMDPCGSAYVECVPFAEGYTGCFWDTQEHILGDFRSCSDTSICHDCESSNTGCFRRDMTIEYCLDLCCMRDYAIAGIEVGSECFCGNAGSNYANTSPGQLEDSRCNQRCAGEAGTRCGGAFEIQIYNCSAWTEPATRCKVPPAPENGMVDGAQRDYATGDMVSFSCIAGYRIAGQATSLTCGINGVWNSSPPDCQNIDECEEDSPCQNGGRCQNTDGDYTCICSSGYTGKDCQFADDIDECEEDSPCQNGGRCQNTNGDYACICSSGYTGKDCQFADGVVCPLLPDYPNAVPSTTARTYDTAVTFDCVKNYRHVRKEPALLTCSGDATWTGTTPLCRDESDCNTLDTYPNATPNPVDETALGTRVTFTCSSGLSLGNKETMFKKCKEPGIWIGQDPVCQAHVVHSSLVALIFGFFTFILYDQYNSYIW